jgi:hypothetical protein
MGRGINAVDEEDGWHESERLFRQDYRKSRIGGNSFR